MPPEHLLGDRRKPRKRLSRWPMAGRRTFWKPTTKGCKSPLSFLHCTCCRCMISCSRNSVIYWLAIIPIEQNTFLWQYVGFHAYACVQIFVLWLRTRKPTMCSWCGSPAEPIYGLDPLVACSPDWGSLCHDFKRFSQRSVIGRNYKIV
jgi:hypothetical protein